MGINNLDQIYFKGKIKLFSKEEIRKRLGKDRGDFLGVNIYLGIVFFFDIVDVRK